MPTSRRRRLKKRLAYRAARIIRPVIVAYVDLYLDDEVGGPEKPGTDPRSTVYGQFEVAANVDHTTPLTFGFSSDRRAHAERDRARPGTASASRWPPGV